MFGLSRRYIHVHAYILMQRTSGTKGRAAGELMSCVAQPIDAHSYILTFAYEMPQEVWPAMNPVEMVQIYMDDVCPHTGGSRLI